MEAKPTKTRPAMDGWIEKGGKFSLGVSCKVGGRFRRKTRLQAQLEREKGVTIIRGYVPHGADNRGVMIILGAMFLVGLLIAINGSTMLGLLAVLLGGAIYVTMTGDSMNSETLMKEVRKLLKAKDKPPK
ncbi:MAG: hypothetical protein ACPG7F_03000 [Aggregatilineales bacterium]